MNIELQNYLILFPGLDEEQRESIRMICHFFELFSKIFPNRKLPYRLPNPKKDPRKSHLFKCCLKSYRELKEKNGPEPRLWIIAQLKILAAIIVNDEIIITGAILYGAKAWNRWHIYQKHAKQQANKIAQLLPVQIKSIIFFMESTHQKLIGTDLTKIKLTKEISAVYCMLHPICVDIAKKHSWQYFGIDPNRIIGLDNKEVLIAFERITGILPHGPKL